MRSVFALLAFVVAAAAAAQPPDFTAVARDAGGSVVNLTGSFRPVLPDLPLAEELDDDPGMRDYVRRYFGPAPEQRSLGAGFVIDEAGHVITNAHLVTEGQEVVVRLADRREFEAKLIGYDRISDIALLKIDAARLQPARIGDAAKLRPGEWVAAIGSPFGLELSVTAGIVSAVRRTLPEESFVPFIQTDVAVNPGNSGGPLFNLRGEVVGVNSGFYSDSGIYQGVSFAVPIDVAMDVVAELRAHGKVTRGRIGVRLQEVTTDLARAFQLPRTAGALVLEVFRGSGAARAAIIPGDVIVRFAGQPIETDGDLVRLTAAAKPGTYVDLELVRFGAPLTARVRIDEARGPAMPPAPPPMSEHDLAGLKVAPLSVQQRQRLRVDAGLMVEMPGPVGRQAGLQRGDVVLSVNGKTVSSADGFRNALGAAGKGGTVALLVQRDGARQFLPMRLPR